MKNIIKYFEQKDYKNLFEQETQIQNGSIVLVLNDQIKTKKNILEAYQEALNYQGYGIGSWGSLFETLENEDVFDGKKIKRLTVFHPDINHIADEKDRRDYITMIKDLNILLNQSLEEYKDGHSEEQLRTGSLKWFINNQKSNREITYWFNKKDKDYIDKIS